MKEGNVTVSMDTYNITNNNKGNPGGDPKDTIANIKDSSKGIDPESLPRLFSMYILKDGYGGTGLGLYVYKNIVETHGGRIWAKNSEYGKGNTFSFSLPVKTT